jgi:uncharacterized protein (TIGR01777 family)
MRVAITGATGLIGAQLVKLLRDRGDSVVAISRDPTRAERRLGVDARMLEAVDFDGVDGVVNLAGEPIAQRWTAAAKGRIRSSRVQGTERLIERLNDADPRPAVLVSASAAGYYGDGGAKELDESSPPGSDFLASLCVDWETAADGAEGMRVVKLRTGVVLDRSGGALAKLLPPFRAGLGGPVAGGRQYMPWVALKDIVGLYVAALDEQSWSGSVNAGAPNPVTNAEFAKALGRSLNRPALLPLPAFALRLLFGEMASVVTAGQRMVPRRALELGYEFAYSNLAEGLKAALG